MRSASFTKAAARAATAVLVCGSAACFSDDPVATDGECESFAQNVTVQIHDFRFEPAVACVARGGEVTWVNAGAELHTSTGAAPARLWDSGLLSNGETFSRTFNEAGEFDYFCIPHPFMQGVVIVE